MFILTESKRNLIIVISLMIGFIFVPTTAQAQPFTMGNVPDYCSATPLTVTTTQVASKIDQYGKMDSEFRANIVKLRYRLIKTGCVNYCKWFSFNIFSLLENGKLMFNNSPNPEVIEDFAERTTTYPMMRGELGSNAYAKRELDFSQFIRELEKLPNNDHLFAMYYDYRDYLEVKAGKKETYPSHAFNIVKDSAGNIRIITTTAKLSEMMSVFEDMSLNEEFFQNPETLSKLFTREKTPFDVLVHHRFQIIGINRDGNVTEIAPDTPPPGNEGPEGESTDSPEGGE